MLDELAEVVWPIVLRDGFGVDGFTDVATHGAIYVNRAGLRTGNVDHRGLLRGL